MLKLRDYQQEMIDKVIQSLRAGHRKIMVVLPTGGGKTAIASELVRRSYERGKSSIFMCHRQELLDQTYATYGKNGIIPAFIKGGRHPDYNNPMQIASVNTLVRRLDKYKVPDIVFVDECHHSKASQWNEILDWAGDSVVIGLTATPCRLDGKPLNDMYDKMIQTVSTKDLIKRGYLVPYLYYAPSVIDTSELVSSNGDYTKKSLEAASFNSKIIGDNIEQYKKLANGKRNVVFAISRKHGYGICERYNNAGIRAEFLDGETPDKERKATLDRFRTGETSVLINVDLFGEGFDLPAIEVVSLLRPTQSTSLYLQQVGRALRTCPELGKTKAIILDHVNNYKTHGMPDEEREWSLNTGYKPKRVQEGSTVSIKRCPMCFFAHSPSLECPNCGYKYTADGKIIKEVAGELTLVGSQEYNDLLKKEVIVANSLEDLVKIERDRGYKFGWSERQYQMKTGINLKSSLDGYEEIAKARGYNHSWAWVQWNRVRRGF
jgi:superfamily II DNA or RNA helicase